MDSQEFDFLESIVKFIEAKTIIEVGVQFGYMAVHLCRASNYNGGKYIGFDIWSKHGQNMQFKQMGSKESVSNLLTQSGLNNFTLIEIDTINNRTLFDSEIARLCPNGIDFAFIDADHSYKGIANDFFTVYPYLNPTGVIAFHDTAKIDGCREFILDLRTKYNDGTFDISDYPFGTNTRHCGVTLLTKRSFPAIPIAIDEICGGISKPNEIEYKEVEWLKNETKNKPSIPKYFEGTISPNNIGYYNPGRIKFSSL